MVKYEYIPSIENDGADALSRLEERNYIKMLNCNGLEISKRYQAFKKAHHGHEIINNVIIHI